MGENFTFILNLSLLFDFPTTCIYYYYCNGSSCYLNTRDYEPFYSCNIKKKDVMKVGGRGGVVSLGLAVEGKA